MKTNEWAKTLLYVYKYLGRVSDGIDNLIMQKALNSFYVRGEKKAENAVMAVADKLIDLSARKNRLINIKVLADKSLCAIEKGLAQILIERYMDNDDAELISTRHNLNIRTYFRRLNKAEVNFSKALARLGFNDEKLLKYLEHEKWIIEVYEKFKDEREDFNENQI